MNSLQTRALNQAISLLRASGAQFGIIAANGEKHGDLEVATPKARRRSTPIFDHVRKHGYIEKLEAAKPGDILSFPGLTSLQEAMSLRGAISAWAIRAWGSDKVMTELKHPADGTHTVNALVVAKD